MNIYINIVWLCTGVITGLFGALIFKKKKFNLIVCIGKNKVTDKDSFSDFYGKAVVFLGLVIGLSSVFCWNDMSYFTVSLLLMAVGVLYFILESFHLVRLYSK